MNRTQRRSSFFLLVVGIGIYGCAQESHGKCHGRKARPLRTPRPQRWEEDFEAAAAARDQYRNQKLRLAEEKQTELQKQLDQERLVAANEREALKTEIKLRSNGRRDTFSKRNTTVSGRVSRISWLQAETSLNPNVPNIPTILVPPIPATTSNFHHPH